ncbi:MAG: phage holin family protein [Candidatus Binatia bacterium]
MALPATQRTDALTGGPIADNSAGAAFEQLVSSTQGVISKRIDLAVLEGREIVSESLHRAGWGGAGIVLATVTWLSLMMSLVFLFLPNAAPAIRLATFALINGIAAAACLAFAERSKRRSQPETPTTVSRREMR